MSKESDTIGESLGDILGAALRENRRTETERLSSELRKRAEKAGIKLAKYPYGNEKIDVLEMPQAREFRPIFLRNDDDYKRILRIPFEKFRFLEGFSAIVNYDSHKIECGISVSRQGFQVPMNRVLARIFSENGADVATELVLSPPTEKVPEIRLGPPTAEFKALVSGRTSQFTISLVGKVSNHAEAVNQLITYSNSVFLQFDLLYGVPLALDRERGRFFRRPIRSRLSGTEILQYPKTQYDEAPCALYWYGRSADRMPLLQFLAFYQVVEYFFPVYSQAEAQRRVRILLKDPTFRADKDTDISKIVNAIKSTKSGGFFDERTQLKATIRECITADQIRRFFEEDNSRMKFYKEEFKAVHPAKIPVVSKEEDLRDAVAERIYAIRCKIVHTKQADSGEPEFELMLPYSKEEENLFADIELMAFVARASIIASGASLAS